MEIYDFRKLTRDQVHQLVSWAEIEGWNPGPHDADLFYTTDPEGFYGYFLKDQLIGGGSLVSYNGAFGFMGLFIMKPEFRNQGIGEQLWNLRKSTLLKRLQPNAAIGMDGVVAMQPFYQKGGFAFAFTDERHENTGKPYPVHPAITQVSKEDLPFILKLDRECFGFERNAFMSSWLFQPQGHAFKYSDDAGLQGFVVLRKVKVGYKIGPLFAENLQAAEALYERCLTAVEGEKIYLDIPLTNPLAIALTKKYQSLPVFACGRMYFGVAPSLPIQKIYGITTLELG